MKLLNKKAIISGASQGLGATIADFFVKEGASVVICARDKKLLFEKKVKLQSIAPNEVKVVAVVVDVSSPKEVKQLCEVAEIELGGLDILVANAGVYGPKGCFETNDWEEWNRTIDINLKGTALQCRAVVPLFKKQKQGKIILIAGGGATKPMPNFSAYAASKAGIIRFSETLAQELSPFNINVTAISPGALNTRMLEEVLSIGPEIVGEKFYQQAIRQKEKGGDSLELAAKLCVYLASETNGITGKLISAIWDPWEKFHKYYEEIINTDIYTLRRIVPEDREINWESSK
ncbi:MAG: SDR family NAD(P)-dependent oxidoreductase [Rickettsia endosymbiont of Ixodes persulcatus]|nr:SDR family NAD(P)-dependent oxidoreductase [Rickettsia endosymbiont of Ixodes persulcatus]